MDKESVVLIDVASRSTSQQVRRESPSAKASLVLLRFVPLHSYSPFFPERNKKKNNGRILILIIFRILKPGGERELTSICIHIKRFHNLLRNGRTRIRSMIGGFLYPFVNTRNICSNSPISARSHQSEVSASVLVYSLLHSRQLLNR